MNQNNAAQAAQQHPIDEAIVILTEEADSLSECHTRTPGDWAGEPEAKARYDHILAVVDALSKLRAPVAGERISLRGAASLAFNALHECKPAKGAEKQYSDAIQALQSALHDIAYTVNRTATPQQFANHLQREARSALASAPVAGEAVAHAVISYGRIQRLVVNEESAHEYAEQQRLNAEAAGWDAKAHVRPLVYGDAAPQASAEDVRKEALHLLREARALLPVFTTAEAIGAWSEKVRKFGAGETIDVPPQADKPTRPCTCPSGDGSLRHPCAAHPTDRQQRDGGSHENA